MSASSIDPVKLTQSLISCPSVTPTDAGVLQTLQDQLEEIGFRCTRMPFEETGTEAVDNLFASYGEGAPHLCFGGHTDVVPVGNSASWTNDPFDAVIKDGNLYGRGTADEVCYCRIYCGC